MKKRMRSLLCLLLSIVLLLQAAPLSALAAHLATRQLEEAEQILNTPSAAADQFTDVPKDSWYYQAVGYVVDNKIFAGTSDTTFTPSGNMTRAMTVSVLSRMAGIDAEDYVGEASFSDVLAGSWYEAPVAWAVKYGITAGTGDGKFSPDRNVTRQEIAVLFVRYFTIFGVSLGDENLSASEPTDIGDCADWAKDSVLVLWQRGLMVGDGSGKFYPEKLITRAECAVLCMQLYRASDDWKAMPGESPWVPVKPGAEGEYKITFYNEDGGYITTMAAQNGLGLGAENVPFYADPDAENGVYFWGWFYYSEEDENLHLFNTLYPYNEDIELHAYCGTQSDVVKYLEDECYIIEGEVNTDFVVTIRPLDPDAEFNPDYDLAVYANEFDRRSGYEVVELENGDYEIHIIGYQPGVYYTMVLNKDFVFINNETGEPMDELIRYIEFYVKKPVNTELKFREDIVWLPASEAQYFAQLGATPGFGVERPADDTETPLGNSIFSYNPQTSKYTFNVGTVICVYSDATVTVNDPDGNPIEVQRVAPYERDYDEAAYEGLGYSYADLYDGTEDAFYIVTEISQATDFRVACTYRELNSDEISQILYVPDVIPYMVSELPGETGGTIENYVAYDREVYAAYSGDKKPQPAVGDFVVLYTDELQYYSEQDFAAMRRGEYKGEIPYAYGRITAVDGNRLTYVPAAEDEVVSAMNYIDDFYLERYIPKNLLPEITEDELNDFTDQTLQLLDDETIRAFITTAIEEEAEQGTEYGEEALEILNNNEISISPAIRNNTRAGGEYADDTKAIQVTGKQVAIDIDDSKLAYLPNTEGKWHLSLNIGMMLIVKLRLREGVNLYYTISANFTQEISIGLSASGRFDVKWYLCVPVPKHVEFSLSATADIATDITMDIRHYTIDKNHMGKQSLYGRQADAQEMWENFQDFLLSPRFVAHGAALYKLEAEYYELVNEALAIDKSDATAREAAEVKVRLKAKEINAFWSDVQIGLSQAWDRYYVSGGSLEWSQMQSEAAKKAAFAAKDEFVANVINISQHLGPVEKLVNWATTDSAKKIDDAGTELADLDSDGKETEEWKTTQAKLQAASQALKDQRANTRALTESTYTQIDQAMRDALGFLNTAKGTIQMLHDSAVKENNTAAINSTQTALDFVNSAIGTISVARRLIAAVKHIIEAVNGVIKALAGDCGDICEVVAEGYNVTRVLVLALKDCRLVMSELQDNFFTDPNSEQYKNCQEGIDVINKITDKGDVLLDWFHILAVMLSNNPAPAETTDGITDVPTTTTYWKFRAIRGADFQEFSLNTEILDHLNAPDDGLDDENIKQIAAKYAEMCSITNTWMDLYRKEIASTEIPIFPGLDATIGADFVVQANINIAANANFHVQYGKEFKLTIDILDWDIDFQCLDRANQKLSVSVIAMGTLGLRAGFEVKFGVKIIKIFTINATVEIMPYINLYAYVFFQYTRDLKNGDSETKLKGAMYIDVGIHLGFNLALKMDILIYKNTWKWNLWNKNISLVDIGDRRNVYNFGYEQPKISDIEGKAGDVETAVSGTDAEKGKLNTRPDGLLIVNSATDYKLPASARNMAYMDMTNGSLGKVSYDAGHYEYKFFTVPKEYDGNTYKVANNLPLYNQMEEVQLTDENGKPVYEENNGAGLPNTITVDIDHSDFEEKYIIESNTGTPVMTEKPTGRVLIDIDGINAGKYVEDKRFSVDKDGRITFTPETGAQGGVYAQDVYVYIEWKEGSLEVSNYPVRRIVHILWTNENPISWLNFEVVLVERNRITQEDEEYIVWSDTTVKGYDTEYIPPLETVLNLVDEDQLIYDREQTTYTGTADNLGTLLHYPQESHTYYIRTEMKQYSLDVHGLNADGTDRVVTYTQDYGYKIPIPAVFTETVTTTDSEGNPKYLRFAGYLAVQDNDGEIETWTGKWDSPIDTALALDLSDENLPRYLQAIYEDETVKAKFSFLGIDREPIVQYLRRGNAPDMEAVNVIIEAMKVQATLEGKTLNVEFSELPGVLRSDKEFIINCRTTEIAPPTVTQIGNSLKVKIEADPDLVEMDENDVLLYGYVPNDGSELETNWLPAGENVADVADGVEYNYYVCLVDGETMDCTYSAATQKTITGSNDDVGYETVLYVGSDKANPYMPVLVTVKVLYTTGVYSEQQTVLLGAGEHATITLDLDCNPTMIASVYMNVHATDGSTVSNSYRMYINGEAIHPDREDVAWATDYITMNFARNVEQWQYARFAFEEIPLE